MEPCKLCWSTRDTRGELADLTQGLWETCDLLKQQVQASLSHTRISEMPLDLYVWATEVYHTFQRYFSEVLWELSHNAARCTGP